MKKGFYRAMIALLAVPMVGAALTGCDNGKDPGTHEEDQQTDFKSVEIVNKEALASGEWFEKGAISDLELKVTKKDGTVIEGVDLDDLWADELIALSSSDEAVISTAGGFLTIAGEGTATVTVTLDGVLTDTVTITVLAYDDPIKNKPEMVTTPVAGTAYKLGVEQYGLATPSMLYLQTTVIPGGSYYWLTTSTFGEALDVVVEEAATPSGDYKWVLKTEESGKVTYLGVASSGTHVNDTNESTPTTLWKWDAEHKTFLTYVENDDKGNGDYYLGTSGTYNTLSFSNAATYLGKDGSYESHLYVIPQVMDVTNKEITLLTQERTTDKINVVKPQGKVTFVITEGQEYITLGDDGTVTAVHEGVSKVKVSDTKTEIEVTITVRAPQKGEISTMPMTAAEAIAKAATLDGSKSEQTEEKYYIEDTIVDNPTTDYCNFNYSDGTKKMVVYGLWTSDGSQRYGTKRDNIQPEFVAGDKVKVHGNLQNYKGTTLEVTNAWLKGFEHQEVTVDVEAEHAIVTGLPASGKAMNCSTVTFTVTPETDYEVVAVSVYGQKLTETGGSYSFVVKGAAVITVITKDTSAGGDVATEFTDTFKPTDFTGVGSYTTDGTEYTKETTYCAYNATGINSSDNIRGNKSANGGNFNLRNTTNMEGYYVSKIVITTSGDGTIDVATANRSVLIVGSSVFSKITNTTVPTGTQVTGVAGDHVYTWTNTSKTASSFILYSLKTSGTVTAVSIAVTWTPAE